jgi:hypothetical protein
MPPSVVQFASPPVQDAVEPTAPLQPANWQAKRKP